MSPPAENAPTAPCPVCGAPAARDRARNRYAPFCSRRCADVDLHRWLSGGYAVPAGEDEDADPYAPPQADEDRP
jgi:endogenous inhibitor of DNA gyrase (YacG/DUF329 family)